LKRPEECPPLKDVLDAFPPRTQLDTLLQFFFSNINNHYYIIYGPKFLEEYHSWWDRRQNKMPLSLQWTALLAVICATVIQHLHPESEAWKSLTYTTTPDQFSERLHLLGRTLAQSPEARRYSLVNVQRLLHSIYWYKAEARFVEAWHDIGVAVREAQELGLHHEAGMDGLSDFDREMRRRVWCILVTWDWQFASGLCRPTLIDHTDVDVQQPTLHLENFYPSPLLYMRLQSEVIELLAARFGAPKNVKTPTDILRYREILEQWIQSFPAVYNPVNTDFSKDHERPWVIHHRYYIHTMAYLMILNPIRTYMANTYTKSSTPEELLVRETGIEYSIKNLETTTRWADYAHPRDGRFHFIIFSLFDTASVLGAAILKDDENTLPKEEILVVIHNALALLRKLATRSKTAKTSYSILSKIVRRLPRPPQASTTARKRLKASEPTRAASPSFSPPGGMKNRPKTESAGYTPETSPSGYMSSAASVASMGIQSLTPESMTSSVELSMQENPTPPRLIPLRASPSFVPSEYEPKGQQSYVNPGLAQPVPQQQHGPGYQGNVQPDYFLDPATTSAPPVSSSYVPDVYAPDNFSPPMFSSESSNLEPITGNDLGNFSQLWDWQTLNFGFVVPGNAS
jgi:hypothetical protein